MSAYFRWSARIGAVHVLGFWVLGCEAELPRVAPPGALDAGTSVEFEPRTSGGVSPVFRAALPGAPPRPLPRLFRGALSPHQLSRADDENLSATLQELLVPIWSEVDEGVTHVVPLNALPAERYTLVTGARQSHEFDVVLSGEPVLERVWPSEARSGGAAVYCRKGRGLAEPQWPQQVDVPSAAGEWIALPGGECAVMQMGRLPHRASLTAFRQAGMVAEPTVFVAQPQPDLDPIECEGEAALGGCVRVVEEQVVIDGPAFGTFWRVGSHYSALLPSGRWVIPDLPIQSELTLEFQVWDVYGRRETGVLRLRTGGARSHLVISEVMADPLGTEPAQEWVELYNAGTASVDLGGWQLGDLESLATLPQVKLDPEHFALVVPEEFETRAGWAIVPEANTRVIRVSRLGTGGLSNSGEALRLVSPSGKLVSRFPPSPPPKPGVSVARRDPWSPDDVVGLFAPHSAPGESPGAANSVE